MPCSSRAIDDGAVRDRPGDPFRFGAFDGVDRTPALLRLLLDLDDLGREVVLNAGEVLFARLHDRVALVLADDDDRDLHAEPEASALRRVRIQRKPGPMVRRRSWISFALMLSAGIACKETPKTPAAPRDAGNPGENSDVEEDDEIRPVYPDKPKEIPPAVTKLCKALHELPRVRRAECCKGTPGILLTAECERNLAGAIEVGGVKLLEEKIEGCAKAIAAQHEGCDWVGPTPLPTPRECFGLVAGLVKPGARCRSTLECPDTMRCLGSGPTDRGRCGPSAPPGFACNTGVDPLVTYLRQTDVDKKRPACDGFCDRQRCRKAVPAGEKCISSVMCESGHRCKEGICTKGEKSALGEPCIGGDCPEGLRCSQKICKKPGKPGDPCEVNTDCVSVCEAKRCKTSCQVAPVLKQLSPPPVKPELQKSRKKRNKAK